MSDIKTLVKQNALKAPHDVISRLLSAVGRGAIAPISGDKEPGLFMLYSMGDSIDDIAIKTNYPADIVLLTALYYKWHEKTKLLRIEDPDSVPNKLQKDLVNSILAATFVSLQKDLGEVIAGKKPASECALIPSNITALQKLIQMVSEVNKTADSTEQPGTTVVHAENVQINQQVKPEQPKSIEDEAAKQAAKMIMLKALDDV